MTYWISPGGTVLPDSGNLDLTKEGYTKLIDYAEYKVLADRVQQLETSLQQSISVIEKAKAQIDSYKQDIKAVNQFKWEMRLRGINVE